MLLQEIHTIIQQSSCKPKTPTKMSLNNRFLRINNSAEEDIHDAPPEEIGVITPEIAKESYQKTPYEEFIPTINLQFDKPAEEMDFDKLQNLLTDDAVIFGVERRSTIVKIALLSMSEEELEINEKYEKFIFEFKGKLNTSMDKTVIGNLVDEQLNVPKDDDVKKAINKLSFNQLQNTEDLSKMDIDKIKKEIFGKLKDEAVKKDWNFILSHEDLYVQMEDQLRKDLYYNPFEMIIAGTTVVANKNFNEYVKCKKQIPEDNLTECFLYHGSRLENH